MAETIVSNTEMSTTNDFAVGPNNDYVYWADDGFNQIRRKSADGTGSVETLVNTGISTTLPHRGGLFSYVYWADNGNDTIKRAARPSGRDGVTTIADSSDGREQRRRPGGGRQLSSTGRTTAMTPYARCRHSAPTR